MEQQKIKRMYSNVTLFVVIAVVLALANVFLLIFVEREVKTMGLLSNQRVQLEQDKRIVESSREILETYKNEVDLISRVFPSEESIPEFIQRLETIARASSDDNSLKFNSLTPIVEQDKLFLFLTVTMKTDFLGLISFLSQLENLPYLTHIVSISAKTDNFLAKGEYSIGLKLYVQNPFTTK